MALRLRRKRERNGPESLRPRFSRFVPGVSCASRRLVRNRWYLARICAAGPVTTGVAGVNFRPRSGQPNAPRTLWPRLAWPLPAFRRAAISNEGDAGILGRSQAVRQWVLVPRSQVRILAPQPPGLCACPGGINATERGMTDPSVFPRWRAAARRGLRVRASQATPRYRPASVPPDCG
jgi:hypothetical protein